MRSKSGVHFKYMSSQILYAIMVANEIYAENGTPLVITSLNDSVHKTDSKHYNGRAVDIRTLNLDRAIDATNIVNLLKSRLGGDFFVLLESDHIHIQYNGE